MKHFFLQNALTDKLTDGKKLCILMWSEVSSHRSWTALVIKQTQITQKWEHCGTCVRTLLAKVTKPVLKAEVTEPSPKKISISIFSTKISCSVQWHFVWRHFVRRHFVRDTTSGGHFVRQHFVRRHFVPWTPRQAILCPVDAGFVHDFAVHEK